MSVAEECLRFCGLFEAELLVELMLRYWKHPHANDAFFRNAILEGAVEVLRLAVSGTSVMPDVAPEKMNFAAAVWCAECNSIQDSLEEDQETLDARKMWLEAVRRSIASCFCDPDLLE